jgi:predicted component of type VI protein secretion system
MKRHLEFVLILLIVLSVCSCASKPEVRPAEPSPGPPGDLSGGEAASYRAEAAAKSAENATAKAREAAERAERAAKRSEDTALQAREAAEKAAKRSEDAAVQAREAAETARRSAKQCEDLANQARQCDSQAVLAREAAERAESAARRAEALAAGRPVPPVPEPTPKPPVKPPVLPEPPSIKTQEAEWRYEKDAIRLHLKSDPQLNLYQRSPHTLVLCAYHLKDPNAFNQLLEEKEGLWKLLECGRFDPTVTNSKRVVIQPGQEMTEALDRPEGAKFFGLVAGYYLLQKERVVRLFPIPVVSERRGNTLYQKPGVLNVNLYMGPQEIQDR